jgi:hypothetical protein
VETLCNGGVASLVTLPGGLRVTPFHPVRHGGQWTFPLTLAPAASQPCPAVYSFVLDGGHELIIDGVSCITLAHGFTESPVVAHPYLGTRAILQDLAKLPGWVEHGRVTLRDGCLVRPRPGALLSALSSNCVVSPKPAAVSTSA